LVEKNNDSETFLIMKKSWKLSWHNFTIV
jgi:hypothetical protein